MVDNSSSRLIVAVACGLLPLALGIGALLVGIALNRWMVALVDRLERRKAQSPAQRNRDEWARKALTWAADGRVSDLSGGDYRWANLDGLNLESLGQQPAANLSGSDLRHVQLVEANLNNVLLRGSNLREAMMRDASLVDARLERADLSHADLNNANLRGANLEGALLRSARLKNADLRGANLNGTDLSSAILSYANLRNASLCGANLSLCSLWNADLRGANLERARLVRAHLEGANLLGANLNETDFRRVLYGLAFEGRLDEWEDCFHGSRPSTSRTLWPEGFTLSPKVKAVEWTERKQREWERSSRFADQPIEYVEYKVRDPDD